MFCAKVEIEIVKKPYVQLWSLKSPNFKNVIFKILEVSSLNSPNTQHGQLRLTHQDLGCFGHATWLEGNSYIFKILEIKMVFF